TSQVAMALFDGQTSRLVVANSRYLDEAAKGTRFDRSNLLGRLWVELALFVDNPLMSEIWDQALSNHQPVHLPEVHYGTTPTGEDMVWDWPMTPIVATEQPQSVRFILVTAVDISAQVRAREELQRIDRLKDEFLSITGHELRTPLAS